MECQNESLIRKSSFIEMYWYQTEYFWFLDNSSINIVHLYDIYYVLNILSIFSLHYVFTQHFTNIFTIIYRHFAYNFPTSSLNFPNFFLTFGQHFANILFSQLFPNFLPTFYQHFPYILPTFYQVFLHIANNILPIFAIYFAYILPVSSLHFDNFANMNEIMYRAQKDLKCVRLCIFH